MSVFEDVMRTFDVNKIMSNGAYAYSHSTNGLPDFSYPDGEKVKISFIENFLQEIQAKLLVYSEFGFDIAAIKIIPNRQGFFGFYVASDFNFVRFKVKENSYELHNGHLIMQDIKLITTQETLPQNQNSNPLFLKAIINHSLGFSMGQILPITQDSTLGYFNTSADNCINFYARGYEFMIRDGKFDFYSIHNEKEMDNSSKIKM